MKTVFIAAALVLAAGQAHASPSSVKITESGAVQKVDCAGGDLIITGNQDQLTVTGCAAISVVGDHNKVMAKLIPESTIATLGNDNHVVFVHAPGVEVQVSSSGKNNEIVPEMGRDLTVTSPVKFPLSH